MSRWCRIALVLLAGVGTASRFRPSSDRGGCRRGSLARCEVSGLAVALQSYRDDRGALPPFELGTLVRYLDGDGSNGGPDRTKYFDFDPCRVRSSCEYEDPWGRPYEYARSGRAAFRIRAPEPHVDPEDWIAYPDLED